MLFQLHYIYRQAKRVDKLESGASPELVTELKVQVVFWVVTPCSILIGYQRFEGNPSP
jgi:hypothetical protein